MKIIAYENLKKILSNVCFDNDNFFPSEFCHTIELLLDTDSDEIIEFLSDQLDLDFNCEVVGNKVYEVVELCKFIWSIINGQDKSDEIRTYTSLST